MKRFLQAVSVLVLTFVFKPEVQAQLADTIWQGNARVTIPALVQCDESGSPLEFPRTTTGLTFILPVEVWFWDESTFLIVYRQGEMGADPNRAALQPLIGEWNIPVAARVGLLTGIPRVTYGSDLFEIQTGSVLRKGKRYTFSGEFRDTVDNTGYDSDWIYPGARTLVTGAFTLSGTLMNASLTAVFSPNPVGPGGIRTSGRNPSATATLTKTNRKPSTEGIFVFEDGPL